MTATQIRTNYVHRSLKHKVMISCHILKAKFKPKRWFPRPSYKDKIHLFVLKPYLFFSNLSVICKELVVTTHV